MMWKIEKPSLKRACGIDINKLVTNCNRLDDTIKAPLKQLYKDYDNQGGTVTKPQLDTIPADKSVIIHSQYSKTRKGHLSYIRSELMEGVFKCPYCSINQPKTLDHYMPEGTYEALATCRMNLVPMCGVCNNLKLAKPYDKFIHCYYQEYPEDPFLKAKVYVIKNRFIVKLYIDYNVIADPDLRKKIKYQTKEIQLFDNINKEKTVYIATLCKSCNCNDNPSLKLWLNEQLSMTEEIFGLNDWRSAILRGMLAFPNLDIATFIYNKKNSPIKAR